MGSFDNSKVGQSVATRLHKSNKYVFSMNTLPTQIEPYLNYKSLES